MPQAKTDYNTPFDNLSARLTQARASLAAITCGYDDGFAISDEYLKDALWAVGELLDQAYSALDLVIDEGMTRRPAAVLQ